MRKLLPCLLILLWAGAAAGNDPLERLKMLWSSAGCLEISFMSIVESDIFSTVDTVLGTARIAPDGRYAITLGNDNYLFDGQAHYSFSLETNQIIIRTGATASELPQIQLFANLDSLYATEPPKTKHLYRLTLRTNMGDDLPNPLELELTADGKRLKQLRFRDVNEDTNRILIDSLKLFDTCGDSWFIPDFPDSAEIVKL